MKNIGLVVLALCAFLGVAGETNAATPAPTRCRVLVFVPFQFQVANRTFPSGFYRFDQVMGNTDGIEVLVVHSLDHPEFYQAVATSVTQVSEGQAESKVVFRHSGTRLVLSEVCSRKKQTVLAISGTENDRVRQLSADNATPNVELSVPSDGDIIALAKPVHLTPAR